jgi:t-SNARE complex subunit (syntaxin)
MGQLLTSSEAAEMSDSEKEAFAADLNATSTTAANAVAQEVKDSAVDVNKIEEDVEDIPTIGEDVGTLLTKKLQEEEEKAKKRAAAVDKAAQ